VKKRNSSNAEEFIHGTRNTLHYLRKEKSGAETEPISLAAHTRSGSGGGGRRPGLTEGGEQSSREEGEQSSRGGGKLEEKPKGGGQGRN
jgi:hypothetical protein